METFLFRCPRTGQKVQGFTPEAVMERDALVQVVCPACGGAHFVNPKREAETGGK